MNKTKTLRFYLTEICDEFHKEKDCYYRLKFAKETVGIFNSLTDVFLKIESLKNQCDFEFYVGINLDR
ncbi:hypothetical protein NBX26_02795 [Mesomycoplasma hyopneumoniae]|uniref:hypothetical protein n=1 Tax=Mesomycoplasma hyopneumoniae TaxID=2099 RepID=UPI0038571A11